MMIDNDDLDMLPLPNFLIVSTDGTVSFETCLFANLTLKKSLFVKIEDNVWINMHDITIRENYLRERAVIFHVGSDPTLQFTNINVYSNIFNNDYWENNPGIIFQDSDSGTSSFTNILFKNNSLSGFNRVFVLYQLTAFQNITIIENIISLDFDNCFILEARLQDGLEIYDINYERNNYVLKDNVVTAFKISGQNTKARNITCQDLF